MKPDKLILHACCAPCSSAIVEWLLANNFEPVIFYYNPNIYPEQEYNIRKCESQRHARELGIRWIDGDYKHDNWLCAMTGLENEPERGKRCLECFKYRLLETAKIAQQEGITRFATTLASSRWKNIEQINEAGLWAARQVPGTEFWAQNWRKNGLQQRRNELLKQYNFYNQLYCGCEFSMKRLEQQQQQSDCRSCQQDNVKTV